MSRAWSSGRCIRCCRSSGRGTARRSGAVMAGARSGEWRLLDDGRVEVGGVTLAADEFQLTARARPGHEVAEEGDLLVALDTQLTPELEAEGLAREVAHRLQTMRKTAGFEISDRVEVSIGGDEAAVADLGPFRDWLAAEVLATTLRPWRRAGIGAGARPGGDAGLPKGGGWTWPSGAPEERHRVPSAHEQRGGLPEPGTVRAAGHGPDRGAGPARRPGDQGARSTRPWRWGSGSR